MIGSPAPGKVPHSSWLVRAMVLLVVASGGCTRSIMLTNALETVPTGLVAPTREEILASPIVKSVNAPAESVWTAAIGVLVKGAVILEANANEKMLFFVKLGGVSKKGEFKFAEFPMAAYLQETESGVTKIYVLGLPAETLVEDSSFKEAYESFALREATMFIDQVSAEAEAKIRWPWLRGATSEEATFPFL